MKRLYYSLLLIVLLVVTPSMATAADKNTEKLLNKAPNHFYYPDQDAVVWKEEKIFDYSKKIKQENHDYAVKIFTKQGAKDYSQVTIKYNPQRYKLKITKAEVINPSGKVVEVKEEQIKDQTIKYSPNRTLYQSNHKKIINFPALKEGSILIYSYQKELKKPLIPEEIQLVERINSHQSKVILKIPDNKKINTKVRPSNELSRPIVSSQEGVKTYTWSGYKVDGELFISSLDSWKEFSDWYSNLVAEKEELKQELKVQVRNLTTGLKTKESKIRELYNYVATEIRYINHDLGVNGYQPVAANKIYKQKYAVAKDKVHFLISLLREIDIKANPVVMNSKVDFNSFIAAANFNHMLIYLPEYDRYLDPVSGFIRYGNLSLSGQGKKVLNLKTGEISKTPILFKTVNQEKIKARVDLKELGAAELSFELEAQGFYDFIAKAVFGKLNSIGREEMLNKILSKYYTDFKLEKINLSGVEDVEYISKFDLKFKVDDYYNLKQGKMSIQPLKMPISLLLSIADAKNTLPCKINKKIIINIPPGYELSSLPKDKELSNDEGKLNVNYRLGIDKIIVNFNYQFNRLANVERINWVYVEELLNQFKEIKSKPILLE